MACKHHTTFCNEAGSSRNRSEDDWALATLRVPNHCSTRCSTQHSSSVCGDHNENTVNRGVQIKASNACCLSFMHAWYVASLIAMLCSSPQLQ
jgi:hypothetical protein